MEEGQDKGLFNNILDSVVNAWEKSVKLVKKHGILYSIFIMLIFVFFWTLIVNPIRINNILEERLKHQWEQNQKEQVEEQNTMIERRYEANEIVGDIMTKILYKYKANRVMLLEKSNGTKSLGNVDYLYINATMEFLDNSNPDIEYISEDLQRQMTMNLLGTQMINSLKHSKYLWYDDLQTYKRSQCRLLNKLKVQGEKQCLIYPFCDKNHRPLLLLVVCGDDLNYKEIVNYIDEFSKQISDLLIFE